MHRWDARWKIIAIMVFILATAMLQHLGAAGASLLVSITMLACLRLPARVIIKRMASVNLLLLPCFLIIPFTTPGRTVTYAGVTFSAEGLWLALLFYVRALAIVYASMALIYSTPMTLLLRAAGALKIPHPFIQVALLTYRYLFSLGWEWSNIRNALRTRGFQNQTALRSYKVLANVIGITLIRSLERTDRIYHAMRCRGYEGTIRTLVRFHTQPSDLVLSSGLGIITLVVIVGDCIWKG